jgi:hypothetical protein
MMWRWRQNTPLVHGWGTARAFAKDTRPLVGQSRSCCVCVCGAIRTHGDICPSRMSPWERIDYHWRRIAEVFPPPLYCLPNVLCMRSCRVRSRNVECAYGTELFAPRVPVAYCGIGVENSVLLRNAEMWRNPPAELSRSALCDYPSFDCGPPPRWGAPSIVRRFIKRVLKDVRPKFV